MASSRRSTILRRLRELKERQRRIVIKERSQPLRESYRAPSDVRQDGQQTPRGGGIIVKYRDVLPERHVGALAPVVAPVDGVESRLTLPLAAASLRLRRRPGRPRTASVGDNRGDNRLGHRAQVRAMPTVVNGGALDLISTARLLDRQQAAEYLSISTDVLDRMNLPRVCLSVGHRSIRKVLYDRVDLDALIARSR